MFQRHVDNVSNARRPIAQEVSAAEQSDETATFSIKIAAYLVAAACLIFSLMTLSACSSSSSGTLTVDTGLTGGVAATVNGVEIPEDDVTREINTNRISLAYYYSLDTTSESGWQSYLSLVGTSAEQLRLNVIDTLIDEQIVEQFASERGVEITDEDVESSVSNMRSNYESSDDSSSSSAATSSDASSSSATSSSDAETNEAWLRALQQAGFADEQAYKDEVRYQLLTQDLVDSFMNEVEVDDQTLLEAAPDYMSTFDGAKKSSHILFDSEDEETAQSVLDQIRAGTLDFATAAAQYSTDTSSAEDGGNVGWDRIESFVTEYQDALDELNVGEISDLVQSDYGWHIITVTEEFTAPDDLTSLDQIPEEIREAMRSTIQSTLAESNFNDWVTEKRDESEIVINDPPNGLPYWVNVDVANSSSSSAATEAESSSSSAAEDSLASSSAAESSSSEAEQSSSATSATTTGDSNQQDTGQS